MPADDTDPQAVFPEDIVSTHWVPKEISLDDERALALDPSCWSAFGKSSRRPQPIRPRRLKFARFWTPLRMHKHLR